MYDFLWEPEALNTPQKHTNMVVYGMFSQPYSQYPVRARADVRSRLSLVTESDLFITELNHTAVFIFLIGNQFC